MGLMILFWVGGSALIGLIGKNRKIGFWPIFAISLVVSPVIGFFVALFSKKKYSMQRVIEYQEAQFRQNYINQSNNRTNQIDKSNAVSNIADELTKFKQLLDNGAITQEEFDYYKSKLLRNS
ncbi:SHOCT domain-containing protein [Sphingobacterium siyangense]|uniref:SHOCT domain-containing protein n=2 Tax=Sphingobacterium TaxID=28453 RepID=UPI00289F9425|nr:SHOCT domain-containing protein [Sphingobacterium siyangense]